MAQYNDQGFVTKLENNEIFVFGSNLAGRHDGGAALQALEQFGAERGIGEGLTGQCYAFPTLHADMSKINRSELFSIRDAFYRCVNAHPKTTFLLTRVGCGIAGQDEEFMAILFRDAPANVRKPKGW